VILIDEAHNLIETINQVHSAELSLAQVNTANAALSVYLRRFQTKLNNKNLYYINLLVAVLNKIRKVLVKNSSGSRKDGFGRGEDGAKPFSVAPTTAPAPPSSSCSSSSSTMTVNDFLFSASLHSTNMFKLRHHMVEVNLLTKISGYADAHSRRTVEVTGATAATATATATSASNTVHGIGTGKGYGVGTSAINTTDSLAALRSVLQLITCLTNAETDGRVFLLNQGSGTSSTFPSSATAATVPSIRYVMLNPAVPFAPIVSEARSVILLGGTMKPFAYVTKSLFPEIPATRLRLFDCEHVVPASQVGALIVPSYEPGNAGSLVQGGPGNSSSSGRRVPFLFTFDTRQSVPLTNALLETLCEVCSHTPGGVVVFCTSFSYLELLVSRWRAARLLGRLDALKKVFVEVRTSSSSSSSSCGVDGDREEEDERGSSNPYREKSNNSSSSSSSSSSSGGIGGVGGVGGIWEAYQRHVRSHPVKGAILFSVISGKLSEGINFSDELARCVLVVGVPYPDTRDPVLQEKMKFAARLDRGELTHSTSCASSSAATATTTASTMSTTGSQLLAPLSTALNTRDAALESTSYNTAAGRSLCEGMCMKAVNQSIGRAIRHVQDFACVVLLDQRYHTQPQLQAQLPAWIRRRLLTCISTGSTADTSVTTKTSTLTLGTALQRFFQAQQQP
jgi:chromosome transmission fidelity protein 1